MVYYSTRNNLKGVPSAAAICEGISPEGGLFVPETIPAIGAEEFAALRNSDYRGRASAVLKKYLTDFTDEEIDGCVGSAYGENFENGEPAPLVKIGDKFYVTELWHGPTCAFKDLALQLLPRLLTAASGKAGGGRKSLILVATSGDTGKAALEGFRDVPGTEVMVFYPAEGVSAMQKLQMCTQSGENVYVCGINGNFDDAQTAVKRMFTDPVMISRVAGRNMRFSSANSINWGRLVPQIVYYVSAYCELANRGEDLSDGFDVAVPTGNFGNILAAYYAKRSGVPIKRLICASNKNRVLTDFMHTGTYSRNREFYKTCSPSMDILVSSNLERMLYELCGHDCERVADMQKSLAETGEFTVGSDVSESMKEIFYAGSRDDEQTLEIIRRFYRERGYLADTHTAVALGVCEDYIKSEGVGRPVVVMSTASPYKFAPAVLKAITGETVRGDEFDAIRELHNLTGKPVPAPLSSLKNRDIRFGNVCEKEEIPDTVLANL